MVNNKVGLAIGITLLAGLTACSSSLQVEPAVGAASQFCIELGAVLPVSVGGALLRGTDPESPGTKAWGDPAIVLRCGVAEPTSFSATSQLLSVNQLSWYPEELQAGVRFTTLETTELVEVSIPSIYQSPADILTDLSSEISSLVP